jgi:hypothetical protein
MHPLLAEMRADRTQEANEAAAIAALSDPQLLEELFDARDGRNQPLAGDAADTITRVSNHQVELLVSYFDRVVTGTGSKVSRVRWESVATLARLATIAPNRVAPLLPDVERLIAGDKSVVVRDNAIDILHRYGKTSHEAAAQAVDPLIVAAGVFEGKHAARVLAALVDFVPLVPDAHDRLMLAAVSGLGDGRSSVKTAARKLQRALEKATS